VHAIRRRATQTAAKAKRPQSTPRPTVLLSATSPVVTDRDEAADRLIAARASEASRSAHRPPAERVPELPRRLPLQGRLRLRPVCLAMYSARSARSIKSCTSRSAMSVESFSRPALSRCGSFAVCSPPRSSRTLCSQRRTGRRRAGRRIAEYACDKFPGRAYSASRAENLSSREELT
jgi:hypothetical protein